MPRNRQQGSVRSHERNCFQLRRGEARKKKEAERVEAGRIPRSMPVKAIQHVRRMRGGAQGQLMRADDGHFYVVKFQNNPQHVRVLANELLASRLAEEVGLPVAAPELVEVDAWLVRHTPELTIQLAGRTLPCQPGMSFGSRYVVDPVDEAAQVFDFLPEEMIGRVKNLGAFAGMLALDKWTCNANGRQATFWKRVRDRKYTVTFIDQGYCFNAGEWSFPDSPLRGVYGRNSVYAGVTGWESFEPWLTRIEEMKEESLWALADTVPAEWYGNRDDMERLIERLIARRSRVRELIEDFRRSSREPFPNWRKAARVAVQAASALVN